MRVLIASESKTDRDVMARQLAERAHVVEAVAPAAALKKLEDGLCEVLVLDWAMSRPSPIELLARLRSLEGPKHVYAIVVMSHPLESSVVAAFAAGTDDLLRRPFFPEELVVRVGAIERIRRWAAKIIGQDVEPTLKITRLRFGAVGGGRAIRHDVASFLQRDLELREPSTVGERPGVSVEIPLTIVHEKIECRLQIGIDQASISTAASILLGPGEPSAEAVADMLRELANVAGGAFIGAAEAEGISVTLGLPTNGGLHAVWGKPAGVVEELTLGVPNSAFELSLRVLVESRELRMLLPGELKPGMVVALDIAGATGLLLVPAATRLTEASIRRLRELLQPGISTVVLAQ